MVLTARPESEGPMARSAPGSNPGEPDREALPGLLPWPRRLTLAGLWAERLAQAFWPLWTILLAAFAALAFGVQDALPLPWLRGGLAVVGLALVLAAGQGLRRLRPPTMAEALARLDATLPGRPIAALRDNQVLGADDPGARAVWRLHRERMAARAGRARAVAPDLRLSARDPLSLRYVALTAAVMAGLFGSFWRLGEVAGIAPGPAAAMPGGPSWEGWIRPPAYTGKPALYLNEFLGDTIEIPAGSRLQIRLYGPEGSLSIAQDVAQTERAGPEEVPAALPGVAGEGTPQSPSGLHEFRIDRSGRLAIEGRGGREWQVVAVPDLAPAIAIDGPMRRTADGRFRQGFTASDDYGVAAGRVTVTLDTARVERRFGLAIDPEPVAPVTLDLPLPVRGSRAAITGTLIDDLSKSVLANMPVRMEFAVRDAPGNEGRAAPYEVTLPGLRFFDPMAAAVAEMRRDLLWNRANLGRSLRLLKAVTWRPGDLSRSEGAVRRLRGFIRMAEGMAQPLADADRDRLAEELWQIAFMFEAGDLGSARERLARAQDRLEEAIRNGASPEEIDRLMQDMQQAMRDYTRELGKEAQRNPQPAPGEGREITADQLQQMLDEIERLMKEGRTAEAMALMEQLRQLMESLQVTMGEGGGDGRGDSATKQLGETLKDQQGLSDDAWRDMQKGRSGEAEGSDPGALAERQRELRRRLEEMRQGQLPGDGREAGEAGRKALERAEEAMREAEDALRNHDLSGALDRQAEAMEAMRDGMKEFGRAMAEARRDANGASDDPQAAGQPDPRGRDPLGREQGDAARIGSDRNMVQNDPDRRARELLEELRRRAGEAGRPERERDYLRRLLDLF